MCNRKSLYPKPALFALLLALSLACGRAPELPNLVLITLDTVRADHLGCYGYFRDTSPSIDSYARQSIFFERCYSPVAGTLPSHVSILSGTYPLEHGISSMRGTHIATWPPGLVSYTSVLEDAGYATAAFISGVPLRRETGINRGFDFYDDPLAKKRWAADTNESAFAWLDTMATAPYFLWVHYFDPHGPHIAPVEYTSLFEGDDRIDSVIADANYLDRIPNGTRPISEVIANYDGQVRYMDEHFGDLLDRLRGREDWSKTIVVVVGDHGQGLGQHATLGHGSAWNEQLHVPLFIVAPGEAPRRVSRLMSTVDILPTLLGLCSDLPPMGSDVQWAGADVLAENGLPPEEVFGQGAGGQVQMDLNPEKERAYTLITPRWKYFYIPGTDRDLLYDLSVDPHELRDVSEEHGDLVEDLRSRLLDRMRTMEGRSSLFRPDAEPGTAEVSEEHLDALRALGYVE